MTCDYLHDVLGLIADQHDSGGFSWRRGEEGEPDFVFSVDCNDVFYWGCADSEDITADNLDVLRQCYADIQVAMDIPFYTAYAGLLFCARVRGMRPQGCAYPKNTKLWPLFDACGPTREIDLGNPYAHPADGGAYEYTG